MQIGNISNNTSFGKIYKVTGTRSEMSRLRVLISEIKKETGNPAMVYNLTGHKILPNQVQRNLNAEQLCVVVTGEESLRSTNRFTGSTLLRFLVTSAEKMVALSPNVKSDAEEILNSIKQNK